MKISLLPSAILFPSIFSTAAFGATLVSTLGEPANVPIPNLVATPAERWASDFLTGSSPTTITDVTMVFRNNDVQAHAEIVSIFQNSGGLPGSLLGIFSTIILPANEIAFTNRSATTAGLNLAANTLYWLVLRQNENRVLNAVSFSTNSGNGTDAGSSFFTVATTPMKYSPDGTTYPAQREVAGNFRFALSGNVFVPEPTAFALLSSTALVFSRRRRLHSNAKNG